MAKTAPSPVDVLDFQFKLQCRLKVFENDSHDTFKKPCSLVTAASRYGLLFVGTSLPKFQVVEIQDIQNYTVKDGDILNYKRRNIPLPSTPKYLSVNCDSTKLCVVVEKDSCVKAIVYDVSSFLKENISILQEIRLSSTPGVNIVDLCWNPSVPSMLVACKDDGTLGLYEVKDNGMEIKELPKTTAATCVCWSPKGKQIVVGTANGKLTQYKLDLQVAKVINAPPINGNPYPISLQWISNYQFIAVYKTTGDDTPMSLIVVDAPKNAEPSYTNYDDVCYSYGNARPHQFYMLQQPLWSILLVASSNSMEVGVMRMEKEYWTQWILTDSARAELPLSAIKQDTLPVGMTFDVSSNKPIPFGENELPPAPYLFLLSHQGVLCCFYTLNLKDGATKICTPPEALPDRSGLTNFTMGDLESNTLQQSSSVTNVVKPTPMAQITVPLQQPVPAFGGNITTPQTTVFPPPPFMTSQKAPVSMPSLFNKPTTQTMTSLFGKQTQPFVTLKSDAQPIITTKQQIDGKKPEKPTESESNQKIITAKPVITQQQIKETTVTETKSASTQKTVTGGIPAINEETEKLLAQMMKEECANLDMEIKVLLTQGSKIKGDLDSDLEATSIVEGVTALQDFSKEMNEINQSQAAEVHVLKQNLIQTWVWYEEARSRFATYKDPTLKSLLLAQPLDAASERKLDEIRHLIYYLESQLAQANAALDEQWETFQDSCKKKLSCRLPNIEAIYQVMVKQNATLQKQVYVLKDISMRIRSKLKNINAPRLLVSLDNTGELEEQLKNLHMEPKDLIQIRYEKVLKRQKRLSKVRVDKLKECFENCNVSHVTVRKPQNTSLTQSTGLSGVIPFSPIVSMKMQREERVNFIQSTPLHEPPKPSTIMTENRPTPSVVVNLFKQEPKSVGGDVKTSAFVPMVSSKSNLFSTGNVEQNSLFKTPQAGVENISKPPMFNMVPPNTAVEIQKSSASSFFGNLPSFDTSSKLVTNEAINKPPVSLPPSVSINVIKSTYPERQTTKPNTFTQFSMPSTQGFSFLTNKPFTTITSAVAEETKIVSTASNSTVNFGGNLTKPSATIFGDKNLFGQNTIEKPSAVFGQIQPRNTEQLKTTTTSTQNVAVTSIPSLFSQVFTSSVSSTQSEIPKNFGQTTSSFFGLQPTLITTSQKNSTQEIFSPSSAVTTSSSDTIISTKASITNTTSQATTEVLTKPLVSTPSTTQERAMTTINSAILTIPSLPAFGQLTTTGASFGNTTTTTSIFIQPVTTTKSAVVIQPLTSISAVTQNATVISTTMTNSTTTTTADQNSNISTTSVTSTLGTTATSSPFIQTSATPIFTQKPTNMFGVITTTSAFGPSSAQTPSIFAQAASTFGQSTTGSSTTLFGQTPSLFSTPITTTTSMFAGTTTPFGQSTTSPTIFGEAATVAPSMFTQQPTTSTSVFGQAIVTPSIFGPTSTSSGFGQTTSSPTSVFGQATLAQTTTPSVTSSIFGQTTSSPTIFGQATIAQTTTPSAFGQTTSTPSLFGQTTAATNVFGQATSNTSVFGVTPSTQSVFGVTPSTQSTFGQPTSTASIFGQPTSTSSIFGQPTSTSSVFGQTPSTSSIFGQPPTVFGQTTSTSPIFGQQQQTIFGQPTTSVFGQPATTTSIFGQPTTSVPSAFGQNSFGNNSIFKTSTNNVFGGTSPFGQTPTTTSVFGSSPFGSTNIFGSNSANNNVFAKPTFGTSDNLNFGALNTGPTTTTSATNVFGSSFNSFRTTDKDQSFNATNNIFESPSTTSTTSVFGNSPFSKSTPAFGAPPTFGASPTFSQPAGFGSTFGSSTTFGNSNQPGPFSGGAASTQTVSQSGFGSPAAFQKPAFISQPSFGSQPSGFGAPPSFGASTFGGSSGFGSPNRVFGNAESFGPNAQPQNSTFANLANQPTVGFGSVAQQAPVESMQQPSFAGGSSFTSWR